MIQFQKIFNPFSQYADHLEKRVDKLLKRIIFLTPLETQRRIQELMQENLVVVNLWLEKRFKGYKNLSKRKRKKFYQNTQTILQEFEIFSSTHLVNDVQLKGLFQRFGLSVTPDRWERLRFLSLIAAFLRPGTHYEYLEGASFSKLLQPVPKEKMIGDCNQIVTFYAFLFSIRFPLDDLRIKTLPGHVCLHYEGIDIEATNGSFQKYEKYEQILPLVEIIPTNLLDITDVRDKSRSIEPRDFVKGCELAYHLSSQKELTGSNLRISYHNLALELVQKGDFAGAKLFAGKTQDDAFEQQIFRMGYAEEYRKLQRQLAGISTQADAKKHKTTYVRMRELAKLMGDEHLYDQLNNIVRTL